MNSAIYLTALLAIVAWALGFFVYGASGLIHLLLVLAISVMLYNIVKNKEITQ